MNTEAKLHLISGQLKAGFSDARLDRGKNGVRIRRSKDFSRHSGTQHAVADVACVGRLVPAATARDDRHLRIADVIYVRANHDFVSRQSRHTRVQDGQSLQHFFNDILRMINKLFHRLVLLDKEREASVVPSILNARNAGQSDASTRIRIWNSENAASSRSDSTGRASEPFCL